MFDFFGLTIIMIRVVAGPFKFLFIFVNVKSIIWCFWCQ